MAASGIKAALIRVLHTGKSSLNWDDETYRAVLARLTGKSSSTQCNAAELQRVLEHMQQVGFPRRSPKHGRRPHVARSRAGVLAKIEALLADAGRPWEYAEAMARNMFRRQAIEWLNDDELRALMAALIIDQKRRQRREEQQ